MPVVGHNHTKEIRAEVAKKVQNVTPVASADATPAAGTNPTKEEFDAVVALANELKQKFNDLLNGLKAK